MAGKRSYLRQLDGLRALSVAAVAGSHWPAYWHIESSIPFADLGVDTFFVISGFLITGILLDNRFETGKFLALRQFYARRFLRIFPLYYLTLAVALILDAQTVRDTWYWHVTYLSNFLFYTHGWLGQVSHFWSLAVEEQFYLVWPLLVIFLPQRFILPVILAGIAGAPVFAIAMNLFYTGNAPGLTAAILTPSCLDALGIGALLAYGLRHDYSMKSLVYALFLTGLVLCNVWCWGDFSDPWKPVCRLGEDCLLGCVVFGAAEGFSGPVGWLLECAPLRYLGKISYGLYIFHNLAVAIWDGFIRLLGNPPWMWKFYTIPIQIGVFIVITVGLASLSWYALERPINQLKRKFPYPAETLERLEK